MSSVVKLDDGQACEYGTLARLSLHPSHAPRKPRGFLRYVVGLVVSGQIRMCRFHIRLRAELETIMKTVIGALTRSCDKGAARS